MSYFITHQPNFDTGIISEPRLLFGGGHEHIDPKVGLALYGPYSMKDQSSPSLKSITVGIVGPKSMIADTEQWINALKGILTNDGSEPFLYPHFPGINQNIPFECELIIGDAWRESIKDSDLSAVLKIDNFQEKIRAVVNLYEKGIEVLSQRDPRPQVIICALSQEIVDYCAVKKTQSGEIKRFKTTDAEKKTRKMFLLGQQALFEDMNPSIGVEDIEIGGNNLRRGIKAKAMKYGIPTQLVWPRTIDLKNIGKKTSGSQDIATRAWNFTTALYHKAGGSPWRLSNIDPGTCFIGISFYRELGSRNPRMRSSLAQAFTSAGDGYVLRGNSFEWDEEAFGKSPHLDHISAASIVKDVIELYQRQNRGSLPSRVVIHKSSTYTDDEREGFENATKNIPQTDFVSIGWRKIQLYREGIYPTIRGTYVKFTDSNFLLYTVGYIPFLRTYPGARTPQPIEITEHYGDSPWDVVLQEIIALTKMNWNSADFSCSLPITLAFSKRVGEILSELPINRALRPEYRFYM